jgi:proteic killer suppression protein
VIKSFRNRATAAIFQGLVPRSLHPALAKRALVKMIMIERARDLADLRVPPGNRLEALSADRTGQHSIRVNDQFRICFVWRDGDAYDVEFCDYH